MDNHEVTDFHSQVLERSRSIPVLVDFWADWCGPCKVLGPVLESLEQKSGGRWVLAKLDTDKNQEIAAEYGIRGIPNVKLFVDGKVADEFTGALPERMVEQWLEKALPNRFRRDLEQARKDMKNNPTAARKTFERILREDPGNEEARALLARLLVTTDPEKAVDLVSAIEENSDSFPMAESIRTLADLSMKVAHPDLLPDDPVKPAYIDAIRSAKAHDYDAALERFIDVIRLNRSYDDDGSRKACIALFRFLGEEDEVSRKHRRDFSGALNF